MGSSCARFPPARIRARGVDDRLTDSGRVPHARIFAEAFYEEDPCCGVALVPGHMAREILPDHLPRAGAASDGSAPQAHPFPPQACRLIWRGATKLRARSVHCGKLSQCFGRRKAPNVVRYWPPPKFAPSPPNFAQALAISPTVKNRTTWSSDWPACRNGVFSA